MAFILQVRGKGTVSLEGRPVAGRDASARSPFAPTCCRSQPAHGNLRLVASLLGCKADARRELNVALQMAEEMRMSELKRELLLNLAYTDLCEGDPQGALRTLAAVHDAAAAFTQQDQLVPIFGMQVHAFTQQGQLGRAHDCVEEALRMALALGDAGALAGCVLMALDDAERELAAVGDIAALKQPDDRAGMRHSGRLNWRWRVARGAWRTGASAGATRPLAARDHAC